MQVDNFVALINDFLNTSSIIFYMIASDFTTEIKMKKLAGDGLTAI